MPGPWEKFQLEWIDSDRFAPKTVNGNYLTGGQRSGFGGLNDVPFHTDAKAIGPWEQFTAVLTR